MSSVISTHLQGRTGILCPHWNIYICFPEELWHSMVNIGLDICLPLIIQLLKDKDGTVSILGVSVIEYLEHSESWINIFCFIKLIHEWMNQWPQK